MADQARLKQVKDQQKSISNQLQDLSSSDQQSYILQADLLRLKGEESSLKLSLYAKRVDTHQIALIPKEQDNGQLSYHLAENTGPFTTAWRWAGYENNNFKLSAGGAGQECPAYRVVR